jgi:aryl-alcohol dehydrogenase-like predicted oxidoreductase
MQFTTLGKSELKSSRIGFGCWAIGGTDWGPVDDDESIRAIRRAMDLGVNFFDTADVYGDGHSEEVLGRALGDERNKVLVATKVGGVRQKGRPPRHDTSYRHIMEAIDASLTRLGTDHVDLYQIHVPDAATPVSETMHALTELVKKGKVRYVGLSNMDVRQTAEYMQHGHITTMQPGYSMIERQPEKELFPFCLANKVSVLAYSPMARGLLTGKYGKGSSFHPGDVRQVDSEFRGKTFEINLKCIERLRPLAEGRTLGQLAVAWALSHPAVTVALVGAKTVAQVEENAAAYDKPLSADALARINKILDETEAEKKAYRDSVIAFLSGNPITKVETEEKGKALLEDMVLWMLFLHGERSVGSETLQPLFSTAILMKSKGTLGQEQCLEDLRGKLAAIHAETEKP